MTCYAIRSGSPRVFFCGLCKKRVEHPTVVPGSPQRSVFHTAAFQTVLCYFVLFSVDDVAGRKPQTRHRNNNALHAMRVILWSGLRLFGPRGSEPRPVLYYALILGQSN